MVEHVPWDDADALDKLVEQLGADRVAAFFCEPVIGAGGVYPPPEGYLASVRETCRRHDVLFIADEVITGFGRTGALLATERFGLGPGMITPAKGLGPGEPPVGGGIPPAPGGRPRGPPGGSCPRGGRPRGWPGCPARRSARPPRAGPTPARPPRTPGPACAAGRGAPGRASGTRRKARRSGRPGPGPVRCSRRARGGPRSHPRAGRPPP